MPATEFITLRIPPQCDILLLCDVLSSELRSIALIKTKYIKLRLLNAIGHLVDAIANLDSIMTSNGVIFHASSERVDIIKPQKIVTPFYMCDDHFHELV